MSAATKPQPQSIMKQTLDKNMFVDMFFAVRPRQFSHSALCALWDYYEEIDRESEAEIEFDPIAICCDWTEYESAIEAAEEYSFPDKPEEDDLEGDPEAKALDYLSDETTVLRTDSGSVLVLNY